MTRAIIFITIALFGLAACDPAGVRPGVVPGVVQSASVQFRLLDSLNTLRAAAGAPDLSLNSQLTAAAATHAQDMSRQNRPWHFGSDGSSPIDRARRVGYQGEIRGEAISETFETEVETLAAWMEDPNTRRVMLDPAAKDIGFAGYREGTGKFWWTLVLGNPNSDGFTPEARPTAIQ